MKVLVIGASGRVGSRALLSCLERGHSVTAFLRTPSKIPNLDLLTHQYGNNLRIIKGDATSKEDLVEAMKGQEAIIQAAVYGSNSPFGTSDSELAVRTIVSAALSIQSQTESTNALRIWILSGQVLLNLPHTAPRHKIEGDYLPIHPEHYANYAYLLGHASELDWSLLCPGKIDEGEPKGALVRTVDEVGLWVKPWWITGWIPFIGPLLNIIYNFTQQYLTYKSVGDFLADNLGPGGDMTHKRVGLLENWKESAKNK